MDCDNTTSQVGILGQLKSNSIHTIQQFLLLVGNLRILSTRYWYEARSLATSSPMAGMTWNDYSFDASVVQQGHASSAFRLGFDMRKIPHEDEDQCALDAICGEDSNGLCDRVSADTGLSIDCWETSTPKYAIVISSHLGAPYRRYLERRYLERTAIAEDVYGGITTLPQLNWTRL
ncbi:hypothetical protein IV203_004754 [Nitzschia inconspicua]|uniref:Uncharacterized protein n=1 Tax=Nitzschia inconspicua TaxID=303405 RepID=A0A9K3K882_9STRA|nr:hypothetical protein IV203_004754 [Nitzschia inconspicua]